MVKDQVHITARTAQISKDKQQSVITLRHEGQSIRKLKLALMRTATGKLQRISSLELTAPHIAAQINASQSSSHRHISTSTVQRRLRESVIHGQIAAKKPLLEHQ